MVEVRKFREAVSMNAQALLSRADLEFAEAALREVLVGEFRQDARADASSLDRMLIHLVNMREAINTSPARYADVARRLGDFEINTTRMASRNPDAAPALTRLSQALGAAKMRLCGSGDIAKAQ